MENKSSLGVVSLVLGIISVVLALVVGILLPWVGLICGIIGLVLGVKARQSAPSGVATAGFVLSIIGTVWSAIQVIIFIACAGVLAASYLSML